MEQSKELDKDQNCNDHDVDKINEAKGQPSIASLELLTNYRRGFKRLRGERITELSHDRPAAYVELSGEELSTQDIMRIAGARFILSSSAKAGNIHLQANDFDLPFTGLTEKDPAKLELIECLLASAEKISKKQFNSARILLNQCDILSSDARNVVQKVVRYFSIALQERLDREEGRLGREEGRIATDDFDLKQLYLDRALMVLTPESLACYEKIPFCQIYYFTSVQTIVETVSGAKKVHVIDFSIRSGVRWTILMQALASQSESPIELLTITAVGTNFQNFIEDSGKRLKNFAQNIGLPFAFKVVMVSDILDLKEDQLEIEKDEMVAIYFDHLLEILIPTPNRMDTLIRVIGNLNPRILVLVNAETNFSSEVFVKRFVEALFHFAAYFDCLDSCMEENDVNKMVFEEIYLGESIRNIMAMEGDARKFRDVRIDVWRAFFTRFGMEQVELSTSNLYQAKLIVKKFACSINCTLDEVDKSLFIGWKGTPLHSLSAWKFT